MNNDPKEIAERLDDLLADDQLRRQFAKKGRKYVEAKYDRKAIAQRLSDDLVRIVADNDTRRMPLLN